MDQRRRFVLFDFDGVIADSFAVALGTSRHFFPDITEQEYQDMFNENIHDSFERRALRQPTNETRDYWEIYLPLMRSEGKLFYGIKEVVEELASSHTLVIVSSSTSEIIRELLASSGCAEHFAEVMGTDVHKSKVEKIRMVLEKYETTADDCVFVTDTLGDIREAKEHSMGVIACSWGFHRHETLQKGIPFRIVDHPRELPDAVEDYFGGRV